MAVIVTNHAKRRLKERCGISKGSAQRMAERAIRIGKAHKDTYGKLHKWISGLYLRHGIANNIHIYGHRAYIFKDETLITVIPVPDDTEHGNDNVNILENKMQQKEAEKIEATVEAEKIAEDVSTQIHEDNTLHAMFTTKQTCVIKLKKVKVPGYMRTSTPKEETIARHENYYNTHGKIETPIVIDKDHYLLQGFLDWVVATAKGYQKVDCIIQNDVSLELTGKTAERYRILDEQKGKCYWCQKSLDYSQSGLVQIEGKSCCLCQKCRDKYSGLMNEDIPSKSYYVRKSGGKTKINFALIRYEIENNLKEKGIMVKKISLLNDNKGKYIGVRLDEANGDKVTENDFVKMSEKFEIRVQES